MPPLPLPNELYDPILTQLPVETLATLSLLSRAWQAGVFPHLYKAPRLCLEEHLVQFAERLSTDDGHSPLSMAANVKCLTLYHEFMGKIQGREEIKQESLEHLKAIVPRLPRLNRISWQIGLVPDDLEILPLFQGHPNLDSVHVRISYLRHELADTDQHRALFHFTKLTHISLHYSDLPTPLGEDHLALVGSMLAASPNLISVKLGFSSYISPYLLRAPPADAIFTSMGEHSSFTSLRLFHLRGILDFKWGDWFTHPSSSTSPLRSFFARHPGIQDLVLDPHQYSGYRGEIQPNDLSHLFPSLKHFGGPAFLCKPLVRSSVAERIETLAITDKALERSTELGVIAEGAKPLPMLRQLTISAWNRAHGPVDSRLSGMKVLLQASTLLEKLKTAAPLYNYPLFVELLKQLPNLREIQLHRSTLPHAGRHENDGRGEKFEWEEYIPRLAQICPCLETVRAATSVIGGSIWGVSRGADGVIDVKPVRESRRGLSIYPD